MFYFPAGDYCGFRFLLAGSISPLLLPAKFSLPGKLFPAYGETMLYKETGPRLRLGIRGIVYSRRDVLFARAHLTIYRIFAIISTPASYFQ